MRYKKIAMLSFISILSFFSCKGKTSNASNTSESENQDSVLVEDREPFDADSAYNLVETQIKFGARTPNSKAHEDCRNWIINKIKSYGFEVEQQVFEGKDYFGKTVKGYNIITHINPQITERILLLAHYDTRQVSDNDPNAKNRELPVMGADDGASGVAVLLETLRTIANYPHRYDSTGIDMIFVDLEDNGGTNSDGSDNDNWCLGSKHYAKQIKNASDKPIYGILLDMVGAKDAKFCFELYSKAYAERYQASIWDLAKKLGYNNYFIPKTGSAITDDHVPLITIAGIPTVDIINFDNDREGGFGKHWHTQNDDISVIDKNTLKAVGETVLTFIKKPL